MNKKKRHLSSFQIIIFGFLAVILTGAFLLMLPFSTREAGGASFMDALFTATSATCVTGLVVQDTGTYWSSFGHFVVLLLIQIGGMGVVTVAVAVTMVSGRKIGLMQRSTMQEAIAAPTVGGIVRLTGFILRTALAIELAGAVLLAPVFCQEFGLVRGCFYSLFHSISAFCNAGIDLMGVKGKFSSLSSYVSHPLVNLVIILLIVVGGIGFLTWEDLRVNKWRFQKYRMQTKVILSVTALLILLPSVYFYFYEFSQEQWEGLSGGERAWGAVFQAITPRTAGFNTLDFDNFSEPGKLVVILLMLVGGAPGSTAGGMKVTTLAVLFATSAAVFTRRGEPRFFGRRIATDTVKYAATILMMQLFLCMTGGIILCSVEKLPMLSCLFESASAIGTAGLTLGITTKLGMVSRIVLILLMYMGRVGSMTVIFAAVSGKVHPKVSKLPKEKITVG